MNNEESMATILLAVMELNGGKLTISTSNVTLDQKTLLRNQALEVGEYVMLALSDDGIGMPTEVKKHLFEPFFTTKQNAGGTGLGLAVVYGIILNHFGFIEAARDLGRDTSSLRRWISGQVPVPSVVSQLVEVWLAR